MGIPTKHELVRFAGMTLDMEFTGNSLDCVELCSVQTDSGDSIGDLLECLLTHSGINAWEAAEKALINHLGETDYFGKADAAAKEATHDR